MAFALQRWLHECACVMRYLCSTLPVLLSIMDMNTPKRDVEGEGCTIVCCVLTEREREREREIIRQ
jgi:hypothetical protein